MVLRRAQSLAALLGILLLAIATSPTASDGSRIFLQAGNLTDILRQVSLIGIISLAMTFVILTGGIDLSVGSILALSTAVAAMFRFDDGVPLLRDTGFLFPNSDVGEGDQVSSLIDGTRSKTSPS